MRSAKRDTPIDATRAPEFLDVDPSNEPSKAVANEIDATTADVSAKVLPQGQRSLVDSGAGVVVERQDLLDAPEPKVRRQGEQSGSVGKIAVHEDDSPLILLARSSTLRSPDSEGKEYSCCRDAESLLCDQTPGGLF